MSARMRLGRCASRALRPAGGAALLAGVFLALACLSPLASARQNESDGDNEQVSVVPVQGHVYMLSGDGGNITLQVGEEGVLLVDTGLTSMTGKVLSAVRSIAGDKPIRYILNTSDDPDHTGGNEAIARAGSTIAGFNVVGDIGVSAANQATVVAFQTVLDRMSAPTGKTPAAPEGSWPTDTFMGSEKKFWFNGEGIRIVHQPAHTDGDTIVWFNRSDVVSTGDVFAADRYPRIDLERGGSIQGVIDGLNHLIEIAIPGQFVNGGSEDEAGTMLVPGHGRLCDSADLVFYQEMVTIVRDRIQDLIKKGMTLEQVKAAKPTMDYDPVYGDESGPWSTDRFVEAVYRSLKDKPSSVH